MSKKVTTEDFIRRAKEIHGNKYDYSKVKYVSAKDKICIICPEHGEFMQTPNSHLNGNGCGECARKTLWDKRGRKTTEQFIEDAKRVHGDKYDYSKVEYKGSEVEVTIICPKHGEFKQTPYVHLKGHNCPTCARRPHITTEDFIRRAKEVHGDKYDYSKVNYVNGKTKVTIICHKHGEFDQVAGGHLHGKGCSKCGVESSAKSKLKIQSTEEFVTKARDVHGDKYDYSKVEYVDLNTEVCIICPEHGEFMQLPYLHLNGSRCGKCAGVAKRSTEDFISKAKEVHGDKYDYSKVKYNGAYEDVCIICPIHGEFLQTARRHLRGQGCLGVRAQTILMILLLKLI